MPQPGDANEFYSAQNITPGVGSGELAVVASWNDITDKPTTLAGFGITDGLTAAAAAAAYQPLDTDLTAIAALTSAADKVPYATGSGTWALADLSSYGRTLIDDANAATARTTLGATVVGGSLFTLTNPGAVTFLRVNADNTITARSSADFKTDLALVVGTDVQAYHADLAAFVTNASWSGVDLTLAGAVTLTDGGMVILNGQITITGGGVAATGGNIQAVDGNIVASAGTFIGNGLSVGLGTVSLPSVCFTGDTNTGVFSPGADQYAIATAGVRRIHVNATGLVGIGQDAGSQAFELTGTSKFSTYMGVGADPNSGEGMLKVDGGVGSHALRLVAATGNNLFSAGGSGVISVDASGVPGGRWTVLDSGAVGFGNGSPIARLDIGAINASTITMIVKSAATPTVNLVEYRDSTGAAKSGVTRAFAPQLPTFTVATVPSAADNVRGMIYVSDETGGAVPAFSDGTNWRRVTDRAVVS